MTLLALPKPGPPLIALVGRCLLQAEEVGQAEAEHGRAADAQQLAAGHAVTRVFPWSSGDHEHGRDLQVVGKSVWADCVVGKRCGLGESCAWRVIRPASLRHLLFYWCGMPVVNN